MATVVNYELFQQPNSVVSEVYAALQNGPDGVHVMPCRAIMVGTAGSYTFNNDDGSAVVVTLAASVMYYISVRNALSAAAGTVWYWY